MNLKLQGFERFRGANNAHLLREPLILSKNKASVENRFAAKILDFVLCQVVSGVGAFVWAPLWWITIVFYWGLVDGLGRGQSPGKWLLGLHTIETQRGTKANLYQSWVRNSSLLGLSLAISSNGYWSWIVALFFLVLSLVEAYFIASVRSGVRVGDIVAHTRVFDFKDEHTKFVEQFLKEEETL